jgi:hypothetical protein
VCVCATAATAAAAAAPARCVAAITLHRGQRLLPRLPRDVKAVCTVCDALLIDVHGVRVCVCACVRVDEGQWCTCTTSTNTASFPPSLAPSRAPPPTTATPLSMIYIGAVVYVAVVACQCDYFMV